MFGRYRNKELPRVMHVSVARYRHALPQPGQPLEFLVALHEEGTGFTWQQNVTVSRQEEAFLAQATDDLDRWCRGTALMPEGPRDLIRELGARLYETFIGPQGDRVLSTLTPTALLLDVDETILNLPWELIALAGRPACTQVPVGRLVTTRFRPRLGRDPKQEDSVVRILTVANPTLDLPATEKTVAALKDLAGLHPGFTVEVDVLARTDATRARLAERLSAVEYDILHFAGHAFLDPGAPGSSALRFADGDLAADDVFDLPWAKPPYFVFNSACESGRAVTGQRLVSDQSHSNGLAAAFLACGVYGYAGYFWPVTDDGAGTFAQAFYHELFMRENVGLAFLQARRHALSKLMGKGDLTGYSAVLYGDAASQHRRDIGMAV